MTRKRKADEIARFKEWLTANGAEVLAPTNPYEVVRFRSSRGTSILYRKDNGGETCVGEVAEARRKFRAGETMRFATATRLRNQGDPVRRAIVERDGPDCFYHGGPIADDDATVEHLVSRTHGGPDHIANKFLSCGECNRRAGHRSAAEKIRLRDELRGQRRSIDAPVHAILCEAA